MFSKNNHQTDPNNYTNWYKTDQISGETVNKCSNYISDRITTSTTVPHRDQICIKLHTCEFDVYVNANISKHVQILSILKTKIIPCKNIIFRCYFIKNSLMTF